MHRTTRFCLCLLGLFALRTVFPFPVRNVQFPVRSASGSSVRRGGFALRLPHTCLVRFYESRVVCRAYTHSAQRLYVYVG